MKDFIVRREMYRQQNMRETGRLQKKIQKMAILYTSTKKKFPNYTIRKQFIDPQRAEKRISLQSTKFFFII